MQMRPMDYCERPLTMYQIELLKGRPIALLSVAWIYYTESI